MNILMDISVSLNLLISHQKLHMILIKRSLIWSVRDLYLKLLQNLKMRVYKKVMIHFNELMFRNISLTQCIHERQFCNFLIPSDIRLIHIVWGIEMRLKRKFD